MGFLSLTSDMGYRDPGLAQVKAMIMSQLPSATIIDVSHDIRSFDIQAAAYCLNAALGTFPANSVHVAAVDREGQDERRHLLLRTQYHWFIGPDNGLFSLILEPGSYEAFRLKPLWEDESRSFPLKNLYVAIACHILKNGKPDEVGIKVPLIHSLDALAAVCSDSEIVGRIRYVDRYGNLVTNISREMFRNVGRGREFEINYRSRPGQGIRRVHQRYGDVILGERVALFNSAGFLEIAINQGAPDISGGASQLTGGRVDDTVTIVFRA